jgi:hypothetical protein
LGVETRKRDEKETTMVSLKGKTDAELKAYWDSRERRAYTVDLTVAGLWAMAVGCVLTVLKAVTS